MRAQNERAEKLSDVKKIDQDWIAGKQQEFAENLQNNMIGKFLEKQILADKTLYTEAFLCDLQDAIVGEYPKTSDFWQGDEVKFTNSIGGDVYVSPLVYDKSTSSYSVQISVPVIDDSSAIGVLVVGLRNLAKHSDN